MSSVAVMLHLVGTNFLFFPKTPTDNILLNAFSSTECLYKSITASDANASVSSKYFCTFVGMFGLLVSVSFFSFACGPIGAIHWSVVMFRLGFFSRETSMSTGFAAIATSCAISTILSGCFTLLVNLLLTILVL